MFQLVPRTREMTGPVKCCYICIQTRHLPAPTFHPNLPQPWGQYRPSTRHVDGNPLYPSSRTRRVPNLHSTNHAFPYSSEVPFPFARIWLWHPRVLHRQSGEQSFPARVRQHLATLHRQWPSRGVCCCRCFSVMRPRGRRGRVPPRLRGVRCSVLRSGGVGCRGCSFVRLLRGIV